MARPDRFTRLVILAWAVVGALVVSEVARGLLAIGLFSSVTPVLPGVCRVISMPGPLPGPADMALDGADKTLFIAGRDGIYALNLAQPQAQPVKLSGTPASFHPQALSLGHEPGGAPVLVVVNRFGEGRFAVESFALRFEQGAPRLAATNAVQSRFLVHPGGIAALGASRFYVGNDPATNTAIAWLDRYGLLPRADLLFFNGLVFRQAVNGLSDPSAVALSPDGTRLFVASRNQRRVIGFGLDPVSGDIQEKGALALPLRPERMTLDAGGDLWVAGAVKLAAPAPSKVVRVHVDADGVPQSYDTLFADNGKLIDGAGAAARYGDRLFIGSAADNKLLDCALK